MGESADKPTALVVIEALGKKDRLRAIFQDLGYDAEVFGTKGSLAGFPDTLSPVGIDKEFTAYGRRYRSDRHEWAAGVIREKAQNVDAVFIATDADEEGDAIAWDVYQALDGTNTHPLRVRLRSIETDDVRQALEAAAPIRKEDAIPGRTREIVDRAIGATFSGNGVGVGRVSTALLGAIARDKPALQKIRLVAPADDGGKPFIAETDVKDPIDRETADRLVQTRLPTLGSRNPQPLNGKPAPSMGENLVAAGDKLDVSPKRAAQAMQASYEAGHLSYPRAAAKRVSAGARSRIGGILRRAGAKTEAEALPESASGDVHDAPHPTSDVDPRQDPKKVDTEEGVRIQITRDLMKAGQTGRVVEGDGEKLYGALVKEFGDRVARYVAALEWRREEVPRVPGEKSQPRQEIRERRRDTVVLETMLDNGIGRPSTWPDHVETLMERGLVDDDLNVTVKGQRWLETAPSALQDPRTSAAIEQACSRPPARIRQLAESPGASKEPWESYAETIVNALPASIRQPVLRTLQQEAAPETPKVQEPEPEHDVSQQAQFDNKTRA